VVGHGQAENGVRTAVGCSSVGEGWIKCATPMANQMRGNRGMTVMIVRADERTVTSEREQSVNGRALCGGEKRYTSDIYRWRLAAFGGTVGVSECVWERGVTGCSRANQMQPTRGMVLPCWTVFARTFRKFINSVFNCARVRALTWPKKTKTVRAETLRKGKMDVQLVKLAFRGWGKCARDR
jgi:hypothetical protein